LELAKDPLKNLLDAAIFIDNGRSSKTVRLEVVEIIAFSVSCARATGDGINAQNSIKNIRNTKIFTILSLISVCPIPPRIHQGKSTLFLSLLGIFP
jgi:hypothetical protein